MLGQRLRTSVPEARERTTGAFYLVVDIARQASAI